jgi:predicted Zn-dependent protease
LDRASDVDLELLRVASMLESDPLTAAGAATQILRSHPGHPTALLLLATAHRSSGKPAAAVTELTALATAQPASATIQLELARALQAVGRDTEALTALARALKLAPTLAQAWRERSLLHAARGDEVACDTDYARFEALAHEEARCAEAAAALANERLDAAEVLLRNTLARSPQDVIALHLLAQVAAAREDYEEAERLLRDCLRLAPGFSRARFTLVALLHRQAKGEAMLPLLARLLAAEPRNQHYRALQALAYLILGRIAPAIEILEVLVHEHPDSEMAYLNYGHGLRAAGRPDAAVDAYRRCLALKPEFAAAWVALADLKTYRFAAVEVAAMRGALTRQHVRNDDRAQLEFALGKALEDAGDFAASFAHYRRGNELRRAVVRYDAEATARFVQRTQQLLTREFFVARSGWGCEARDPIFIVGLPRSGSTLLEQILASHSSVEGTRELTDVIRFALELGSREQPGPTARYPQSLALLTHEDFRALGERYLTQTRAHRLLDRPHFIDKMGGNFLHIALIHLMLPHARIIDVRRAPLPCCFANFKQHFYRGVPFTSSLEDLGRYYRDYVSLMAHFDEVLPGRIHRVSYERLVADLEGEIRRLLEYCGLPFEAQCLRFHETERVIQTVSSEQVRQPLYYQGLDQWRNFEPWLGPLKAALGDIADAATPRSAPGV